MKHFALTLFVSAAMAGAALAQQSSQPMATMPGMVTMMPNANDSTSTKEYKAAMMKMMEGMPMMKFTGNADVDFMNQMRVHHRGAIDMAKVVLANGKDPEVKKLAQNIITAQEKEIGVIETWLKQKAR